MPSLRDLPDDLVWELLLSIARQAPLSDVAALGACCQRTHAVLQPSEVATQRVPLQPWASQVSALEQLAVWEVLAAMTCHHVTFEGASTDLRDESAEVVDAFGRLLKRFPRARLQVHAHTGRHAPPLYAPRFTRDRAEEVANALLRAHGVERHRVETRGWGKAVAIAADWPPGRDSARGELFVEVGGGLLLPPLPRHYDGVDPELPRHFQPDPDPEMPLLMQLMLQAGGPLGFVPSDEDDDYDYDFDDDASSASEARSEADDGANDESHGASDDSDDLEATSGER